MINGRKAGRSYILYKKWRYSDNTVCFTFLQHMNRELALVSASIADTVGIMLSNVAGLLLQVISIDEKGRE